MTLVPLNDLLELSDSGVWGDEDKQQGISVLRSTNFNADGSLDLNKLTFRALEVRDRSRKLLQPGDILLEKSGGGPKQPVGRVCLFRGDTRPHSFGNFIARLRPRSDVLSEYLHYYLWHLHSVGKTRNYQKQTTGIRNLELKRYLSIAVPMWPLAEQRRIVDLLSRAEGIVRLRREAQAKAQAIIPALFLDMFGDPATNPKGWPVRTVRQIVARFEGGKNLQAGDAANTPFRILKVSAVTTGRYLEAESKPGPADHAPAASHFVRSGDMLFSRANTQDLVGATALVETTNGHTLLPDKLWRIVWSEPVDQRYMHMLFQSQHVRRELGKLSTGTSASMRNISQEKLYQLPLPIAPIEAQLAFGRRADALHSVLVLQIEALNKAEETFQALLARAFSGDLVTATSSEEATVV